MGPQLDHMLFGLPVDGFPTGTGKGVLQDSDIVAQVCPVREVTDERVLRRVNCCGFLPLLGRDDIGGFWKERSLVGEVFN